MLQKIGLLPIISDIAIIVLHFFTPCKRISLVCKTSDKLSNIIEINMTNFKYQKILNMKKLLYFTMQ